MMKKECPNFYLWVSIFYFLMTLLATWAIIHLNSPEERFCSNNPDKCVCENEGHREMSSVMDYDVKEIKEKSNMHDWNCSLTRNKLTCDKCNFRKKTSEELAIDDCNAKPSDGEKCTCTKERSFPQGCVDYQVSVDLNVTEATARCLDWNPICVEARPKTDYEKHPEDYVTETTPKDCLRIEGNKCYITEPTSSQGCWNGSEYLCGGGSSGMFTELKTTYRLKNECEKGEEGWVEVVRQNLYCDGNFIEEIDGQQKVFIKLGYGRKDVSCQIINETTCREKTEVEKLTLEV